MAILISAAHPFYPAQLNLAHFASTYLPADVFSRMCIMFEKKKLFVIGIDVHGGNSNGFINQFLWCLKTKRYAHRIRSQFKYLKVKPDILCRTNKYSTKNTIKLVFPELLEKKKKKESVNYFCRVHGKIPKSDCYFYKNSIKYSIKKDLNQNTLYCKYCNENIKRKKTYQYFLEFNKLNTLIIKIIEMQPDKKLKRILSNIFNNSDFFEWEFTRDHDYNGFIFPFDNKKKLYIWVESLIFKLTSFIKNKMTFTNIMCFFGKNIIQYYLFVFPIFLYHGVKYENLLQFSIRGFCINTNNKEFLDLSKIKKKNIEFIRFFLIYKVNNNYKDFSLSEKIYFNIIKDVLQKKFFAFLELTKEKISNALTINFSKDSYINSSYYKRIFTYFNEGSLKKILHYLENNVIYEKEEFVLSYILVYNVLNCILPKEIKKYSVFKTTGKGFIDFPLILK